MQELESDDLNEKKFDNRILVVEDDRLFQDFAKMALRKKYSVDIAENGYNAIKLYEKNQYKLILLDIDLPDISGIEIAKIIRNLESSTGERSIMIAITGGGEGKRAGCIAAGMDDFISKPFKITLLEQVLDKHNYIRKVNQKSEQDSY